MENSESGTFESTLDRFTYPGGTHYIDVPDTVAAVFSNSAAPVRIVCRLDDRIEFQCALRPKGNGSFFISVGTPVRTKAKLRLGQVIKAVIRKDDSPYGRDMPEELEELLAIDAEGNRLFHELTPSGQRGIIYYIASARTVQTRIDRSIMMIDRLKIPKK